MPQSIKDKSIATYADVIRLLVMFENLRLALAKKRCDGSVIKRVFLKKLGVFPFFKTSGDHLKVFVFKLNQFTFVRRPLLKNSYVDITSK